MKNFFKFGCLPILLLLIILIVIAIISDSNDKKEKEEETKKVLENYEKAKEEEKQISEDVGTETVKALESNEFIKFVEEYKKLGSNKTPVWDNQINGKTVRWSGVVVRAGGSQVFVYANDDYQGESWAELGDAKGQKLFYSFVAKYDDPNEFEGLETGDPITVEGTLDSRGDYDLNYNWKIYNAKLIK